MKRIIKLLLLFSGLFLIVITFSFETKKVVADIIYEKKLEEKEEVLDYFAIIEIPKINLKRELFNIGDDNNQVDKNILVQEDSTFPDEDKSNIILAAHSGGASNAYFKDLDKLDILDDVYIYYKGYKYIYQINYFEEQKKTGYLNIRNDSLKMISLITCKNNTNDKQIIYYGILKNKEKIS